MGGGKKPSGAAKRKKKKEKEKAIAEAEADLERLKLGPTKLWTGLVTHHRDIFLAHVLPKLNGMDRIFFWSTNTESWDLREYAKVRVLFGSVHHCSSVSTLEFAWNMIPWGKKSAHGKVMNQAWFCIQVAATNKLELLKWAREEKKCKWDEETIVMAACQGNIEMIKYCLSNDCPCDEWDTCQQATLAGHLDCLRFLFDELKPSQGTKRSVIIEAAASGHLDILKYCVAERKITDGLFQCVAQAIVRGKLICLKYLVEEVKVPLVDEQFVCAARFDERYECEKYLLEKGAPKPTDQEYKQYCVRRASGMRR